MNSQNNVITKERPILFSGPMVRAILEGRKAQTRRIVKPQPLPCQTHANAIYKHGNGWRYAGVDYNSGVVEECPYGKPGDRLWVRETWATGKYLDGLSPSSIAEKANDAGYTNGKLADLWYQSDDTYFQFGSSPHMFGEKGRLRPSIHMPRWASRITLDITNVRVERLQDITEDDAEAEGIFNESGMHLLSCRYFVFHPDQGCKCGSKGPEKHFADIWESINGKGSWEANPWVWVVEFRMINK